ncbi:MAG TPA: ssDNA-binding protein [Rhabdochlamydiaceae bacterium]
MAFDIEAKKIKGRDFPLARLSYPALIEPKAFQGKGEAKYSATLLISKKDPKLKLLQEKINAAMTEKFGAEAKWPKRWMNPLRDGDEEKPDQPAYRGMVFVKAGAKEDKRPQCLGPDGDLLDPSELYPGCWVKASVIAYAYEYMGKSGAGFALKGIQKVKDGDRFDNADVSSEFDSVSSTDGSEDEENYED